jgi:hypothetical protein
MKKMVFANMKSTPRIATKFGSEMDSMNGKLYPPKKKSDITAEETNILMYSAKR